MSQVTREQFLQQFQDGIDLYKEPMPKALEGTQALEQLREADLNHDLKLTGKVELEKAFVVVEKFDPKAHGQSFEGDNSPARAVYHALLDTRLPKKYDTDGAMAAQNRSTIICDSEGKIGIYIAPGYSDCVRACVVKHERVHQAEALAYDPNSTMCRDRPAGTQVHGQPGNRPGAEVRAAEVELKCLEAALKKKGSACKADVKKQIKKEEGYRDFWKKQLPKP